MQILSQLEFFISLAIVSVKEFGHFMSFKLIKTIKTIRGTGWI